LCSECSEGKKALKKKTRRRRKKKKKKKKKKKMKMKMKRCHLSRLRISKNLEMGHRLIQQPPPLLSSSNEMLLLPWFAFSIPPLGLSYTPQ